MLRSVGVLGGGALGLSAALRMAQHGFKTTLIEQEDSLGGLASGFRTHPDSHATLEKFYHHLFRSDRAAIRLINELGLGDHLVWKTPVTATLRNGRIYPMSPTGMLRFDAVPAVDRLRLIATLAALKLAPNERPFAGQTAGVWMRRWAGPAAYEALLGPLLAGKFGERAPDIAMGWLWSRFHERSLSLGYLQGGFQQLYDAMGARLQETGGEVCLTTRAVSICSANGHVTVETDRGSLQFDALLVTAPQRVLMHLAPDLDRAYGERYPGPDFYSAHVLILALDRPLTDVYWINIADPNYPFLVLVEHTNYMPPSDYDGQHLVYLGNYLPPDAPVFSQGEDEVLATYSPALRRINPAFDGSWVQNRWVFKAPFAQPIVTSGYPDRLPPNRTPLPGVYFATMAHVYPQDRGQNYSILLGERMSELITADLS